MSSTSAVAVLAQGLRDLRDFAEGPDEAELRQRTGLSEQQIDAALAGEQLPTREVTLALVGAWEGDVEAWGAYWTQIAELARDEGRQGTGTKQAVPVAPEPSIITPLPEQDPEPEQGPEEEPGQGPEAENDGEQAAEADEAVAGQADADIAEQQPAGDQDPQNEQDEQDHQGEQAAHDADRSAAGHADTQMRSVVLSVDHSADAEEPADAESQDAADDTAAQELSPWAGQAAAESDAANSTSNTGNAAAAADTEQAPARAAAPADPAQPPRGLTAQPPKKSLLVRAGIPVALFVVGVGVGAFGDHALNSKDTDKPVSASLPPASQSSSSSATGAPSRSSASAPSSTAPTPSGSGTTSSSAGAGSESSSSSSSSASSAGSASSSGATIGAYSGIQLASGYSVDFLNDTYHPSSGTANGPDSMGFFASSFVDGKFYADRVAILDPQETGSYTACLNDTRYQRDVPLSQVSAGSGFCIHTDTGHLVLVTVRRMPSSTDANPYAVVDLTVWQN